jgi:hypothetical protein
MKRAVVIARGRGHDVGTSSSFLLPLIFEVDSARQHKKLEARRLIQRHLSCIFFPEVYSIISPQCLQ